MKSRQMTGAEAAKFFRDAADVVERFGVVDLDFSLQLDRRPTCHFDRSYGYVEAIEEFVRVSGTLEGCGVRRA